ncbi:MAG: peptidoglycan-associated lipoprotein Pal [Rhodocyclales bacterium GT-UBC]|nr:MAG: peptidoglycan-associated lipoprotein Pal [Rhodocyclales bacterium GT-UBC]
MRAFCLYPTAVRAIDPCKLKKDIEVTNRLLGTAGLFALCLVGCASTPKEEAPANTSNTQLSAPAANPGDDLETRQLKEAAAKLSSSSIYFDYDNFSVKTEYNTLLQQQAELLKRYSKLNVSLEGNTDERGSSEYNLALGQKRAEAVRKALVILGVPEARIEAVSLGKEKPKADCPEEKCWSQNRRVDFSAKP